MQIAAAMFFTDYSMSPAELAPALEARGFESLWAPEHSHIPLTRKTPFAGGGELPKRYYDVMDPFVALTAAAMVTTTLKLGTGVCLVVQRDPIQTAKLVASIDQLSGGRFLFGIGNGWNQDEIENHGTVFATRHKLARERVEAMQAIWTQTKPEYHGEFVNFDPMMAWPKPVQKPGTRPLWAAALGGPAGRPDSWWPTGRPRTGRPNSWAADLGGPTLGGRLWAAELLGGRLWAAGRGQLGTSVEANGPSKRRDLVVRRLGQLPGDRLVLAFSLSRPANRRAATLTSTEGTETTGNVRTRLRARVTYPDRRTTRWWVGLVEHLLQAARRQPVDVRPHPVTPRRSAITSSGMASADSIDRGSASSRGTNLLALPPAAAGQRPRGGPRKPPGRTVRPARRCGERQPLAPTAASSTAPGRLGRHGQRLRGVLEQDTATAASAAPTQPGSRSAWETTT